MNTPNREMINYERVVCSKDPTGIWQAHYILFGTLWEIPMHMPCEKYNQLHQELHTWYPAASMQSLVDWVEVRDPSVLTRSFYRHSNGLVIPYHEFEKEVSRFSYPEAVMPEVGQEDSCAGLAIRFPKYWKALPALWKAIDTYRINVLFPITGDDSGRLLHARKKLLVPGTRTGGKTLYTDIAEAHATLGAWLADNAPEQSK